MLEEEAEKRRWHSKDYSDELNKNEIRLDSEAINLELTHRSLTNRQLEERHIVAT